jgi:uncharacterized protein involved in exopolysaccharide biosynthesis
LKAKYNKDSYKSYLQKKKEKRKASRKELREKNIALLKWDIIQTEKKIAELDSKVKVYNSRSRTIRANIDAQKNVLNSSEENLKDEYKNNVQGRYWHMYWINSNKGNRQEALADRKKQKREYSNLSSRYDVCAIRLKKCSRELANERLKLLKLKEQLRQKEL